MHPVDVWLEIPDKPPTRHSQRLLERKKFLIKPCNSSLSGKIVVYRDLSGRTFQFGEGWHSNDNTVRFWTPSPRVPKEADTRCYAYTTAYATMTPLCNVCCARSKMPPPSPR